MDGWDAIIEALKREQIDYVFGLPTTHLMAKLGDVSEIKPVQVRHESSAVFMAMAYSRLKEKPGVVYASAGPGVANMSAAVLEAFASCSPLVMVSPSASFDLDGMGAFQEIDQVSLFKPITKWSVRVLKADRISWYVRRAFSLAINGKPGPVFLDVPGDIGHADVDRMDYVPANRIRSRGDFALIKEAAELIMTAERPVAVAGGGVVLSSAFTEVKDFVESLGIPIMTSPSGRGSISEDHPLALGLVGLYRSRLGKKIYDESDLLIGIGTRFEGFQSGNWLLYPQGAKYVQIDVDPFEIGRNWTPTVGIVGDIKLVLQDLLAVISEKIGKSDFKDIPRVRGLMRARGSYESEVYADAMDDAIPLKSKRIVRELNRVFGTGTILVNENGMQDLWSYYWPYYRVLDVGGCVPPAEQTCMGFGVVGAIGAKMARPEKKVVCVTGDGAFQIAIHELPTAVQYGAPVTWVVLDTFSLGWVKWIQKATLGKATACDFDVQADFSKVAEANHCYGERVDRPGDIRPALERALNANLDGEPAVLDFIVDGEDAHESFVWFHRNVLGLPV